jgi:ferredoxin
MVTLVVDWTRCDGHGVCARILPEAITVDDWGFPVVAATDVDVRAAREAIANCPQLALRTS